MSLGLTYVALSRLKNFHNFLQQQLHAVLLKRLQKLSKSKSLLPRLEEEKRLDYLTQKTLNNYSFI